MCLLVAERRCSMGAPTAAGTLHFPSAPAVGVGAAGGSELLPSVQLWAALGSAGTHSM